MRRLIAVLIALLPTLAPALDIGQQTTFAGGLSVPVGEGSDGVNPGLSLGFESLATIERVYGVGGAIEYTWLSFDHSDFWYADVRGSLHYWSVGLVQKGILPVNEDISLFAGAAPGFYLGLATVHMGSYSNSEVEPDFGISLSTGVNILNFACSFGYRAVFTDGPRPKWITISLGYTD